MRWDRAVLFKLATNERLEQIVKGLPGGEEQAWRAASRYVAGRTRDEALQVAGRTGSAIAFSRLPVVDWATGSARPSRPT